MNEKAGKSSSKRDWTSILLAVWLGQVVYMDGNAADAGDSESTIEQLVHKLIADDHSVAFYKDSEELIDSICRTSVKDISDKDIDAIVGLIAVSTRKGYYDDVTTGAEALASIGPKAKRGIPALKSALAAAKARELYLAQTTGITGRKWSDILEPALAVVEGKLVASCRDNKR